MSYNAFKVIHLFGVVLFLGNIIVTAVWKMLADRTREPAVIAYAQWLVTLTDWIFTAGGVVLIVVGAYGMVAVGGLDLRQTWLVWGQSLFVLSGLIWVAVLIPTQIAQARLAARVRGGRANSGQLLAPRPALGNMGRHRHHRPALQSLLHGLQAVSGSTRGADANAGPDQCRPPLSHLCVQLGRHIVLFPEQLSAQCCLQIAGSKAEAAPDKTTR
jgi:uncharacterized membrane protein